MEKTTPQKIQGKGFAISGFVIGLVALVFYVFIATFVTLSAAFGGGYGLGIFWLALSLSGTTLSILGVMKLRRTGGKTGLGIAGITIGTIALIFTTMLVLSIGQTKSEAAALGGQLIDIKDKFEESMEQSEGQIKYELEQKIEIEEKRKVEDLNERTIDSL